MSIDAKRAAELVRGCHEGCDADVNSPFHDRFEAHQLGASALERLPALLRVMEAAREVVRKYDHTKAMQTDLLLPMSNLFAALSITPEPPR